MSAESPHAEESFLIPLVSAPLLLLLTLLAAASALAYELIIGAVSSYLLGNYPLRFSLTIGGFIFAMGLGSQCAKRTFNDPGFWLLATELSLGTMGLFLVPSLYLFYAHPPFFLAGFAFLVLAIGFLCGLELPLFFLMGRTTIPDEEKRLIWLLGADYLGGFLIAIFFPLALFPYLGLLRTGILLGIINLLIAALLLFAIPDPPRVIRGGFAATIGLLVPVGGVLYANAPSILAYLERMLYG